MTSNRWSLIAGRLPGRTDNEIKNYWNTHIRRKLLSRGIDPATHRPIHGPLSDFTITFAKGEKKDVGILRRDEEKTGSSCSSEESAPWRQYRCPDLNLELSISPPFQQPIEPIKGKRRLCFTCSLGLQRTKECKCNGFLGLGAGVLDYRTVEMK